MVSGSDRVLWVSGRDSDFRNQSTRLPPARTEPFLIPGNCTELSQISGVMGLQAVPEGIDRLRLPGL